MDSCDIVMGVLCFMMDKLGFPRTEILNFNIQNYSSASLVFATTTKSTQNLSFRWLRVDVEQQKEFLTAKYLHLNCFRKFLITLAIHNFENEAKLKLCCLHKDDKRNCEFL